MNGPPDKKLSLKVAVPNVIVTTTPTELIVTDGAPDWAPLQGTNLLYVKNTTGNVFKDLNDQNTYVLVTGRWFRAPDFGRTVAIRAWHELAAGLRQDPG